MHHVRLAILAASIGVGLVASAQPPTGTRPRANIAAGKGLFHQNCSICHGVDAKGYRSSGSGSLYDPDNYDPDPNSAAKSKRVSSADLTALSERNAGKFPADRVRDSIYSKDSIPAHGTPAMPAWGDVFYSLKSNPQRLQERVRDLTAYIESIQRPKK